MVLTQHQYEYDTANHAGWFRYMHSVYGGYRTDAVSEPTQHGAVSMACAIPVEYSQASTLHSEWIAWSTHWDAMPYRYS